MVKTGYFRTITEYGENYISYKEFQSYEPESVAQMRRMTQDGRLRLYCACNECNELELSITAAGVIRVKTNHQQDKHKESCPKSTVYTRWVAEHGNGIYGNEDSQVIFNIAMPAVIKRTYEKRESNGSGEENSKKEVTHKRTSLTEMIRALTSIAWEKQTYSKKKEIKEARKKGEIPNWQYKTYEEYIRLIFGVSNDIAIQVEGQVVPLRAICYHKDTFYANDDYRIRYFMYAEIDRIAEFKEDRKYQYITVKMPSDKSKYKATVRILTEDFKEMVEEAPEKEGMRRVLAGYIHRSRFQNKNDGSISDWITMLKGNICYTTSHGLYVGNELEKAIADRLCEERVIFLKPYMPIEAYGNLVPAFIIEKFKGKSILIDTALSTREYNKKAVFAENNEEYECFILRDESEIEELLIKIRG